MPGPTKKTYLSKGKFIYPIFARRLIFLLYINIPLPIEPKLEDFGFLCLWRRGGVGWGYPAFLPIIVGK